MSAFAAFFSNDPGGALCLLIVVPFFLFPIMAIKTDNNTGLSLSVPTPDDFHDLSVLQNCAFPEQEQKRNYSRYQRYHKECPTKLDHCRIVKQQKNEGGNTIVVAACQLQVRRRSPSDKGDVDVFVEWIGCHPDHRGRGVGTMLLEWAEEFARDTLGAKVLGLYMVRSNTRARRLYERNGFAKVVPPGRRRSGHNTKVSDDKQKEKLRRFRRNYLDRLFGHGSVVQMEKELQ